MVIASLTDHLDQLVVLAGLHHVHWQPIEYRLSRGLAVTVMALRSALSE
jgi:hypothetical protein